MFLYFCIEKYFCNIGPVNPEEVSSLIHVVNAVCTFSRLESFSNNFVEAWAMGKPLMVTDADWARDSCGNAAVYVDPENAAGTAAKMKELIDNSTLSEELVVAGRRQLQIYPTAEQKCKLYLDCIDKAEQLGPCPKEVKRKIHWPKIVRS